MKKIILSSVTIFFALLLANDGNAKTENKDKKSCSIACEEIGAEKGGQLVHQRAKKEISKEEYDKLARKSHNDDLLCLKACRKNKG